MVVEARQGRKRIGIMGIMVLASLGGAAATSTAQTGRDAALDAQQRAFDRMMAAPLDAQAAFQYAETSLAAQDYEGAILAYERLVLLAPDANRLRLDLAYLYARLNAPQLAKSYLDEYLRDPKTTGEDRARAEALASSLAKQSSQARLSGGVTLGFRSQSNANAGPSSPTVRSGGTNFPTSGDSRKQDDVNLFLSGNLRHVYEFADQSGDSFDTDLSVYFSRQSRLRRLDLLSLDLRAGPRLRLFDSMRSLSVRPYAAGTLVGLGNQLYIGGGGGGAQIGWNWSDAFATTVDLDARQRTFYNRDTRPNASDQSGVGYGATARTTWSLDRANSVAIDFGLRRNDASRSWWDSLETSVGASYTLVFASPFGSDAPSWAFTIGGQRVWTDYDSADPAIDRSKTRKDREWRANVTAFAPVSAEWSFYAQGLLSDVASNIENYRFENYSAILGVTRSF